MTRFADERYIYRLLNTAKFPFTTYCPGALYCPRSSQGDKLYLLFLDRVEGETLTPTIFDNMNDDEKDIVKESIWEAYTRLRELRMVHNDARLQNLIWSKETRQITIIDLETVRISPAGE